MKTLLCILFFSFTLNSFSSDVIREIKDHTQMFKQEQKRLSAQLEKIKKYNLDDQILAHYDFFYRVKRDVYPNSSNEKGAQMIHAISRQDLAQALYSEDIPNAKKQKILNKLKRMRTHMAILVGNDQILGPLVELPMNSIEAAGKCNTIICRAFKTLEVFGYSVLTAPLSTPFAANDIINGYHLANADEAVVDLLRDDIDLDANQNYKTFLKMREEKVQRVQRN